MTLTSAASFINAQLASIKVQKTLAAFQDSNASVIAAAKVAGLVE
jgi:formylmethanofuran dehydrogenase subunit B